MKLWFYIGMLLSMALFAACDDGEKVHNTQLELNQEQLTTEQYYKDGIEAYYPRFIAGGSETKINRWNEIINKDVNKILNIYSFNPFPEVSPNQPDTVPTILILGYEVKLNNDLFASFFYTAAFYAKYTAHPTNLVYTTNIDKTKDVRLRLPDYINLNEEFVKNFRTWEPIPSEEGNKELDQAIKDYMNSISDEDLLIGMKAADQIGSKNVWDIFSYLTPERLGISIGVPNYAGDHVEFEQNYTEIEEFINPDYLHLK